MTELAKKCHVTGTMCLEENCIQFDLSRVTFCKDRELRQKFRKKMSFLMDFTEIYQYIKDLTDSSI